MAPEPRPGPDAETDPLVANLGRAGYTLTPNRRSFRLIFTGLDLKPGPITLVAMPSKNPGFRMARTVKWPAIETRWNPKYKVLFDEAPR
jgi:hypothetical protein